MNETMCRIDCWFWGTTPGHRWELSGSSAIKYYFPTVFTYTSSRPETKLKHTCSQVPVPPDWWS